MRLARAPALINIGDVVRGTEENSDLADYFRGGRACAILPVCTLPALLDRAIGAFFEVLDRKTLADLLTPKAQFVRIFDRAMLARVESHDSPE